MIPNIVFKSLESHIDGCPDNKYTFLHMHIHTHINGRFAIKEHIPRKILAECWC